MPASLSHAVNGLATREDIDRLSRAIVALTEAVDRHEASLKLGLTRMGQIQAELDLIRSAWAKLTPRINP